MLAREVVRANKQRDRLVSSKARVGSVQMQLQNQLGESQRGDTTTHRGRLVRREKGANDSDGEGYWGFSQEYGDHESYESIDKITTIQRNHERNEYGNDEGIFPLLILLSRVP